MTMQVTCSKHCDRIVRPHRATTLSTDGRTDLRICAHLEILSHLTFRAQGVERFSVGEGGIRKNFAPLVHRREAGIRAALRVGEAESA